ncbi:hypothetical protein EVAR_4704_1 [Eumeta japonica]|uniref:Uncharacterized protein n=1 Tax=Eumeta variegata TaxID=151549 RepID=A0A4C1WMA6_EUMVA|nr:hypothetical protein EVAR_4704_1 [Eumeta japonica]
MPCTDTARFYYVSGAYIDDFTAPLWSIHLMCLSLPICTSHYSHARRALVYEDDVSQPTNGVEADCTYVSCLCTAVTHIANKKAHLLSTLYGSNSTLDDIVTEPQLIVCYNNCTGDTQYL